MTIEDFQYLVKEYGSDNGWAYTDESRSASFIIFDDKISIHSNFLAQRIFEIFEDDNELSISKSALNKTGDAMVSADMEDEDWDIAYLHWEKLLHDLKYVKQLEKLNIGATIRELLTLIWGNTATKTFSAVPEQIAADPVVIWQIVEQALKQAGLLTAFYWEDWANKGIHALNELSALKSKHVQLNKPNDAEEETIGATLYYTTAILNFFNKQLESHSLTVVAIGAQFEELQTFVCLSGDEQTLEEITAKLEQLCLKYEY